MKVILLRDVGGIGKKYEVKDVSDGHALNYLVPQKLAQVATPSLLKKFEEEKAIEIARKKKEVETVTKAIEALKGGALEMTANMNEKGHLFSAVHKSDLARLVKDRTGLSLPESAFEVTKQIKEAGEHTIGIKAGDKVVKLKIVIK